MDKDIVLALIFVLFWILCPVKAQDKDVGEEILEDLLSKYRASIRQQATYIPGLTQPVLFEPRPRIKPTAGHYTLLLVIPKASVQAAYDKLNADLNHQIVEFWKYDCPQELPCKLLRAMYNKFAPELTMVLTNLQTEMFQFNTLVNRTFQQVNQIVQEKEPSSNPYETNIGAANAGGRNRRYVGTSYDDEPPPSLPDKWARLERLVDNTLAQRNFTHSRQTGRPRWKRFLWSLGNSIAIYRNHKRISRLNDKVNILQRNDQLLDKKIHHLAGVLDQTLVSIHALGDRTDEIIRAQKVLVTALEEQVTHQVSWEKGMMLIYLARQKITMYRHGLEEFRRLVRKYTRWMETLTTGRVTPNLVTPDEMREYLNRMQEELQPIPHLHLPLDPDNDVWTAYSVCKIVPYLLQDFVVVEVDVPLTSSNLDLELYSVHNLPAIHPDSGLSATYRLEGKYFAVSTDKHFIAIPNEDEVAMCEATGNIVCNFKAPLYPRVKCRTCLCALYDDILEDQTRRIMEDCPVHLANATKQQAIYLEDNYWAIVTAGSFMMYITCPKRTYYQKVEPPLSFVNLTGGCMGQASEIFLPALTHVVTAMDLTPRTNMIEQYARLSESYNQMKVWDYINVSTKTLDELRAFKYKELPTLPEHVSMELINQKLETFDTEEESWFASFKTVIIVGIIVFILVPVIGIALYQMYCKGRKKLLCCAVKKAAPEILDMYNGAKSETTDLDLDDMEWDLSEQKAARNSWNASLRARRDSGASDISRVSCQTAIEVPQKTVDPKCLSASSRSSLKSLAAKTVADAIPTSAGKYTHYLADKVAQGAV